MPIPDIQVKLKEDEVETLISILHYADTARQITTMGETPKIDHGMVQTILEKMEASIALYEKKPDDLSKGVKLDA
ncbi:MAG: hypothetical protein ACREA3_08805 [Nitrosotalea sp.]